MQDRQQRTFHLTGEEIKMRVPRGTSMVFVEAGGPRLPVAYLALRPPPGVIFTASPLVAPSPRPACDLPPLPGLFPTLSSSFSLHFLFHFCLLFVSFFFWFFISFLHISPQPVQQAAFVYGEPVLISCCWVREEEHDGKLVSTCERRALWEVFSCQ